MMTDNSEVLDVSKENIQPLRCGRKAAQLKTALQAQVDQEVYQQLMKQREKFEHNIRMYEGEDPLDPYYTYILWLEQSFPSVGRENNIILLLEDALLKFKDCKKYQQDQRLVQLLIKYLNFQTNSLELYQLVYNQGLGTMCSSFYKAWAEEFDKSNDFKRADQVFQIGLQCRAQPLNELQDAHVQFQLSIARKLLEGNVNPLTTSSSMSEQSRAVLSKLPPSKVKSNRACNDSAGIFASSKIFQSSKNSNFTSSKFQVYEENTDDLFQTRYKNETEALPKVCYTNRENVMGANKWCGQKMKQRASKTPSLGAAPTFDIHEDPEAACDNIKTVIRPCALKTRKEEFRCPVAVFGPPNPNQLPMYPKQLVYVGGRDVQLEEIRAAFYWKKIEKQQQINASSDINTCYDPITEVIPPTPVSNVSHNISRNDEKMFKETVASQITNSVSKNDIYCDNTTSNQSDRYTKIFQPDDSQSIDSCDMLITPARPVANIQVYVDEDHFSSRESRTKSETTNAKISSTLDAPSKSILSCRSINNDGAKFSNNGSSATASTHSLEKDFEFLKPAQPKTRILGNIDVLVDDDCPSSRNTGGKQFDDSYFKGMNGRNDVPYYRKSEVAINFCTAERDNSNLNHSLSSSMTINTKAAMNVIQQMWESPLTRQDLLEGMNVQAPVKSNKCLFPVYCEDADIADGQNNELPPSNKLPFPVFCDDTFSQPSNAYPTRVRDEASSLASNVKRDISKSASAFRKHCDSDRKFGTPLPLIVPVKLQDSPVQPENKENRFPAEYATPDDRQKHSDYSNDDEQFSGAINCEMDDETCNTRVFAVTLPSSTPCGRKERTRTIRKSVYDESYQTQDNDFSIGYPKSAPKLIVSHNVSDYYNRSNKTATDLSLILENSKEQGSSNSSSSSNTGSFK